MRYMYFLLDIWEMMLSSSCGAELIVVQTSAMRTPCSPELCSPITWKVCTTYTSRAKNKISSVLRTQSREYE